MKIGARVTGLKKIFYYITSVDYNIGDKVVLQRKDGLFIIEIATKVDLLDQHNEIKKSQILRRANAEDLLQLDKLALRQEYLMDVFNKAIKTLQLKIIPLSVWQAIDGVHINFYYYSPGRIEFNELIKTLIKNIDFRVRIEMVHMDVREVYAQQKSIGVCGKTCCCAQFTYSVACNKETSSEYSEGLCNKTKCCFISEEMEN